MHWTIAWPVRKPLQKTFTKNLSGDNVALVATFRGLAVSLDHLHQGLNELHVMAGDKPEHDEAAVADDMGDSSLELLGALHEARRAAEAANRAVASRPHLDQ